MNGYRKLSDNEIKALIRNGCSATDWNTIEVKDGFCTDVVRSVRFSGKVKLGNFDHEFTLMGDFKIVAGIENVTLHNVIVGDGCRISNIQNYIANYEIGNNTYIENVGIIVVDGESTFGNGVKISVLSETGGRELTIFDKLSSHFAYMAVLYRHRPIFINNLQNIADNYIKTKKNNVGFIGSDVKIVNIQTIKDVYIGDGSLIDGANTLKNGTLNSKIDAPIYIGSGVMLEDFIVCSDSRIEHGAIMSRCFVGQACKFGHGYSASDSLFFCNCQGENGEACAIFAGPYTVTHHKSTLLIAGMFSFMNAGSGSNQSNHMYKLGPIHQGILERGARTASDSYILWPSRVGAFSLVMGRHVTHSDTTNLPFSYLIENKNTTYLAPGVNLRSVGTIRDANKWPKRDGRKDANKLDYVNYNLLSPFTIQKMMKGLDTLNNLRHSSGELSDVYSFHSTKITNSALHKGIEYYQTAIGKFMGNSIISRLQNKDGSFAVDSEEEIHARMHPYSPIGSGEWVDISGLIAPKSEILELMKGIEKGDINTLENVNDAFKKMHENYYSYEWTWAFQHIQKVYGINPSKITKEEIAQIVEKWHNDVIGLDNLVYMDAQKEFNLASMTGYGADGDREQKEADFEQVRGDFDSNSFVQTILQHIEKKNKLADDIIKALNSVH